MSTVVHWGGDLSDEEIDELSNIIGRELLPSVRQDLRSAYYTYVSLSALHDNSLPTKDLRQRLQSIAQTAKQTALSLGADDTYFDEVTAYYRRSGQIAREQLAEETNHRIELELVHLDIDFRKKHGVDPKFAEVEMMRLAWQLAQVSRAADKAIIALAREKRGRPDSGARRFVSAIVGALLEAGLELTCSYDPVEGDYRGSFRPIASWFRKLPLPVRESESTLCKLASSALARRNKDKKGRKGAN